MTKEKMPYRRLPPTSHYATLLNYSFPPPPSSCPILIFWGSNNPLCYRCLGPRHLHHLLLHAPYCPGSRHTSDWISVTPCLDIRHATAIVTLEMSEHRCINTTGKGRWLNLSAMRLPVSPMNVMTHSAVRK